METRRLHASGPWSWTVVTVSHPVLVLETDLWLHKSSKCSLPPSHLSSPRVVFLTVRHVRICKTLVISSYTWLLHFLCLTGLLANFRPFEHFEPALAYSSSSLLNMLFSSFRLCSVTLQRGLSCPAEFLSLQHSTCPTLTFLSFSAYYWSLLLLYIVYHVVFFIRI